MLEEPGPSAGVTPPRVYVPSPVQEAYNPQITDAHFRTLVQMRGLAHTTGGDHTPPLTLEELGALRGISRLMVCRHLHALRSEGYLRIEPSGENAFVIYLRRWEPGTGRPARPARGRGRLTAMERALLFGDAIQSASAAAFKHEEILEDVVVDSHDSQHETVELLHDHDGAFFKNEDAQNGLAQELAGAMIAQGVEADAAREKAKRLLARKRTGRRRAHGRGGSSSGAASWRRRAGVDCAPVPHHRCRQPDGAAALKHPGGLAAAGGEGREEGEEVVHGGGVRDVL
jgi:hypothetical protein